MHTIDLRTEIVDSLWDAYYEETLGDYNHSFERWVADRIGASIHNWNSRKPSAYARFYDEKHAALFLLRWT